MNLAHAIERGRLAHPDHAAVIFDHQTLTYRQLDALSSHAAQRLAGLGVGPGDSVALLLPNRPAFLLAYFGALKLGAVVVAINTALKSEELGFILDDSGARVLVTTPELQAQCAADPSGLKQVLLTEALEGPQDPAAADCQYPALDLAADAPAVLLYTSGTTGFPKGALLTHGHLLDNVRACADAFALTGADRVLLCLPLFHCFGQNAALNPCLEAGATLLLQRQFEQEAVLNAMARERPSVFFGVPTLYSILHESGSPEALRSLRLCISAAASLPPALAHTWKERFGLPIHQGYGLTEIGLACFNRDPERHPDAAGQPLAGIGIHAVDEAGAALPPGETGELVIHTAQALPGYWNQPEATAEAWRDGGFRTGDIGRVDADGRVYLLDRAKDMINVGGVKVYPSEVERVLLRHPGVAAAAVYGVADALLGEQVCASLVPAPGHSPGAEEILAFCTPHLADFKLPAHIEFVDSLPKSPTGKILKRVLRERFQARTASGDGAASARPVTAEAIENWLVHWIADRLGRDAAALHTDAPFVEYGMTSLMIVAMTRALAGWLNRSLEPVLAWSFPTVAGMARYLAATPEDTAVAASGDGLEFWPAVEGYYVYDALLYNRLAGDVQRNHCYQAAIERTVRGKVVLEIGPGATAILSRLCVAAGAEKVYAVERGEDAYRQAKTYLERQGLAEKIVLIHGDATQVTLPEPADVCVSEIVGSFCGSQGAAVIINQVWRLMKPEGIMIPERGLTRVAAVSLPDAALHTPLLPPLARHYTRKIFSQTGHPFDVRLCVKNFPLSHLLSDSAAFEDQDFSRPLPTDYELPITLNIQRPGRLDGFLVWLELHTLAGEVIDILENNASWLPIYLPVFEPGIDVAPGDAIEAVCAGRLSDNGLNPDYRISGRVRRANGETFDFDHTAWHHRPAFRQTALHDRLFAQLDSPEVPAAAPPAAPEPVDAAGDAEISALSDDELFAQLAAELAGGK